MADQSFTVTQNVISLLEDLLDNDGQELPESVATQLWRNRHYEEFTVTAEQSERTFRIVALSGGEFVVLTDDQTRGWYIDSNTAESSAIFPQIKYRGVDTDTNISEEYVFPDPGHLAELTAVAKYEPSPVQRCDPPIKVTHLTLINGIGIPFEWQGLTATDDMFYLRYRSGTIEARVGGDTAIDGSVIYHAFIGREFPGTMLSKQEIITTVAAIDYISIDTDLPDVPDDRMTDLFDTQFPELTGDNPYLVESDDDSDTD